MASRRLHQHRSLLALALSLLVHVVVVLSLVRGAEKKHPAPAPKPEPIKVVWLDAKELTPKTKPAPRPAEVQPAPKPKPHLAKRPRPLPPAPKADDVAPSGGSEVAATPGASSGDAATGDPFSGDTDIGDTSSGMTGSFGDRPRGIARLLPRGDLLPMPDDAERPRGRTLHPGDLPTPEELRAEEAVRVADRTEGWAKQTIAQLKVDVGTVDPYLSDLRSEMVRRLEDAPNFTNPNGLKELGQTLAKSYFTGAENYGKTGSAYEMPEGWRESIEIPDKLKAAVDNGSPQARELASMLYAGARFREFGEGRMGAQLYAVVEIRQQPTGTVEAMTLVQSSGVPMFDTWVMGRAHLAIDTLGGRDGGLNPLKSVWGFTGKVSYKRSVRQLNLKDDWWYVAVAGVTSLMTGSFDEVTGQVDYIDLRHPHYECRVKLLAEY